MLYNAMGLLSSLMFLGCLIGIVKQFQQINRRKHDSKNRGHATQSLSVNGFFSSFIGFYAFFVYSMMLQEIDYYLFVTRLLAASMTIIILFEIFRDREELSQKIPFLTAVIGMIIAFICLEFRDNFLVVGRSVASFLAIGATVVMVQGGIGQIRKIKKEQSTGALSKSMNAIFMAKDLSNVGFGLVLGFTDGWPLIMLGSISAMIKGIILYQFRLYKTNAT